MDKAARGLVFIIAILAILGMVNLLIGNKLKESYVGRAEIANALALASRIKIEVTNHFNQYGEFPRSNYDIGLNQPEYYSGNGLKELIIEDGGVIHLVLGGEDGGEAGHIFMLPQDLTEIAQQRWLCLTPSYRTIAEFAPQCSYKPIDNW
ncbi:MAG: pilin [Pseudomonadota bacterium]